MKLIFASGNTHKVNELQHKIGSKHQIISMREAGFEGEIAEPGDTLEQNARIKAEHIYDLFGENCFADDTGLEVEALDGRPGVYSARYAGESCSFDDNNKKLLGELEGIENRKAKFRTVIHLILNGQHHRFEGTIEGEISKELSGKKGFGYDPLFVPKGYDISFAEMAIEDKNIISHRARAVQKLIDFLREV